MDNSVSWKLSILAIYMSISIAIDFVRFSFQLVVMAFDKNSVVNTELEFLQEELQVFGYFSSASFLTSYCPLSHG